MAKEYAALTHATDFSRGHVVIQWTYFNVCNFACSYCPDFLHAGNVKGVDALFAIKFFHRIFQQIPEKKFYVEFTGGEVTLSPELPAILTFLKERGADTGILTNGSRSLAWWKEHAKLLDHVSMSFHGEQGKAGQFEEVCLLLKDKLTLTVNVIMEPARFDELYQFAERLHRLGVRVSLQGIYENISGPLYSTYSPEQKEKLKTSFPSVEPSKVYRGSLLKISADGTRERTNATELIALGENSWKGWTCMAGVENLSITMAGEIYRGLCREGGRIGTVFDTDFRMPGSGITCSRERCFCGFDVMCTKSKG